ncbi:hypothetical protein A2Y26_03570 [candidate division CPR2 bacterium GWD2_39_7]|nr:MAG: hypothetical protein A2Y26_03570 [candidate division CPR2 bacterium GWD2_39_7]
MLLENEGKVLLIKRSNEPLKDYWCLPGGYVNYGEEPTDAAIREAKEETDLDVKIEGLAGVYMIDNDPRGINIDIIYLGKILGGNLKLNEEASEANYFDPDNLPNLIAYRHREAIEDGFPPSRE